MTTMTTMNTTIDRLMHTIGGEIDDTPEAWARVAMACLDQGMVSARVQDRIAEILRRHAGVDTDPQP